MITALTEILESLVAVSILLFEYIGIIVILFAGFRGVVDLIRRNPQTKLNLAKGLAMGLEFKLGSEILRTVVVRQFSEIAIVGSIIAIRAALTFIIHWEITTEEATVKNKELKK